VQKASIFVKRNDVSARWFQKYGKRASLVCTRKMANASHVRPTRALTGRTQPELPQNFMAGNYVETAARGSGQHHVFVSTFTPPPERYF
jgi:hypothetical protein